MMMTTNKMYQLLIWYPNDPHELPQLFPPKNTFEGCYRDLVTVVMKRVRYNAYIMDKLEEPDELFFSQHIYEIIDMLAEEHIEVIRHRIYEVGADYSNP